jgi:hypothetical protein
MPDVFMDRSINYYFTQGRKDLFRESRLREELENSFLKPNPIPLFPFFLGCFFIEQVFHRIINLI